MEDIKLFANPNSGSNNIVSTWDRIWHRKMHYVKNKKRESSHDRRNQITKSRKNVTLGEKELTNMGNIGSRHHRIKDDRKNFKKSIPIE